MKGDGIHRENMSRYSLITPIFPSDAWMDTYRERFWDKYLESREDVSR